MPRFQIRRNYRHIAFVTAPTKHEAVEKIFGAAINYLWESPDRVGVFRVGQDLIVFVGAPLIDEELEKAKQQHRREYDQLYSRLESDPAYVEEQARLDAAWEKLACSNDLS